MRQANQEKRKEATYTKGVKVSASGRRTNKERLTADRQEARQVMNVKETKKRLKERLSLVADSLKIMRKALADKDYNLVWTESDSLVARSTMSREDAENLADLIALEVLGCPHYEDCEFRQADQCEGNKENWDKRTNLESDRICHVTPENWEWNDKNKSNS